MRKRSSSPAFSSWSIWSPMYLNPVSTRRISKPQSQARASGMAEETMVVTATLEATSSPFSLAMLASQSISKTPISLPESRT